MVEVEVRVAGPADEPVLVRALPDGGPGIHAAFLARQAAGDAAYLVAWRDGQPVGHGVVRWRGRDGNSPPEITNLHVPAPLRGQGIGSALLRHAETMILERGGSEAVIRVGRDNRRAAGLYERLGYADTGRRSTVSYSYLDSAGVEHPRVEHEHVLRRRFA